MTYGLGILDQCPVFPNETAVDALQHTIQLAKDAEAWGYDRFWVAEHHNMEAVASSSPEVLVSHLLAHTQRMEIGSGGVMLQHYSPYKVVENFHLLSALAPGRVNLGVGKSPGGFDLSTAALQYGGRKDDVSFEEKVTFIKQLVDENIPAEHPLAQVRAKPRPTKRPGIFILGTSEKSAEFAAGLGVEFVFARFIQNNDDFLRDAASRFRTLHPKGKFIVALTVLVAPTEEEAVNLAKDLALFEIQYEDGRTVVVQSDQQVEELRNQTDSPFRVSKKDVEVLAGTAQQVKEELDRLHHVYDIDEFIIHTPLGKHFERRRSFELLRPNQWEGEALSGQEEKEDAFLTKK